MAAHFSLYYGTGSASADTALTPVRDGIIPALGTQSVMPRPLQYVGAGAQVSAVSTVSAAYIDIPSVNDLGRPAIAPTFVAAEAPLTFDATMYPIALQTGDPFGVYAAREVADYVVGVFFADNLECPGPEPIALVPYAAGAPAEDEVADRWQSATLTLGVRLPAGQYRILGFRHYQSLTQAARFVLPGQTLRPGGFTMPAGNTEEPSLPGPQTTGVLGTFDAIAPPSLELYVPVVGTPAAGTGFLLLQRIIGGAAGGCGCGKGGGCGCGGACGGGR